MQIIRVETPSAKYDVVTGSGLIESLAPRIERVAGRLPRRVFVLTSGPIWALWSETFLASFTEAPIVQFLEPGEKYKTLGSVEKLLREMARAGADRGSGERLTAVPSRAPAAPRPPNQTDIPPA